VEARLVIVGGTNGTDMLRNGVELGQVHILSILSPSSLSLSSTHDLVWSTPQLVRAEGHASVGGLRNLEDFPGRCHCACLLGTNRIITFGGGARNSNTVTVLDLDVEERERERERVTYYVPNVKGAAPLRRCSCVGALVGKWMVIQGGWHNGHGELSDVQLLDLSYGTSEKYFLQQESGEEMEESEEEREREEEEEDEEEKDDMMALFTQHIRSLVNQRQTAREGEEGQRERERERETVPSLSLQHLLGLMSHLGGGRERGIEEEEEEEEDDDDIWAPIEGEEERESEGEEEGEDDEDEDEEREGEEDEEEEI